MLLKLQDLALKTYADGYCEGSWMRREGRFSKPITSALSAENTHLRLSYIDLDTGEEHIVPLLETAVGTLIFEGCEKLGYAYAVGHSVDDKVGIYRVENRLLTRTGKFSFKNVGEVWRTHPKE